jgi:tetratricopeptide (TPR) repeat protein
MINPFTISSHDRKTATDKQPSEGYVKTEIDLGFASFYSSKTNTEPVQYYKIAYESDPDNLSHIRNLGLAYYYTSSFSEAIPLLNKCIKSDSNALTDKAACATKLGNIYYGLFEKDLFKAFDNYKLAYEFEHENRDYADNVAIVAYYIGFKYENKQDFNKALEYYSITYELQPSRADLTKSLGVIHRNLGDHNKTKLFFEKCLEADINHLFHKADKAICAYELGNVYLSGGLFDKAVKYLKITTELVSNPLFNHHLASIYMSVGDCQKAVPLFENCAQANLTNVFTETIKENCARGIENCKLPSDASYLSYLIGQISSISYATSFS